MHKLLNQTVLIFRDGVVSTSAGTVGCRYITLSHHISTVYALIVKQKGAYISGRSGIY